MTVLAFSGASSAIELKPISETVELRAKTQDTHDIAIVAGTGVPNEDAKDTQADANVGKMTIASEEKSGLLDFLSELPEAKARDLPEPSSVFKDETGNTVCRYTLPDIDIENWLGLWYKRQTDANTKTGIKVSDVRLASFSMHSEHVETLKIWKPSTVGGFGTFVVQEKVAARRKYQVYVAACELLRGGYSFDVDVSVLKCSEEETSKEAAAPVVKKVARERPSSALRQRLLGTSPLAAPKPRPQIPTAPLERVEECSAPDVATVTHVTGSASPEQGAASKDISQPVAETPAAMVAKRQEFMMKLADERQRREEQSGPKRVERQRQLEDEAKRKAEERKQRVREGTPLRSDRSGTPMPVIRDWRQRGSERAPCRVTSG